MSAATAAAAPTLLWVEGLRVHYRGAAGPVCALDGLDLSLAPGQSVALVGESGCGKSSAAWALARLLPAAARVEGRVLFEGSDLLALPAAELRRVRGRRIGYVSQEPAAALDPRMRVEDQVGEALALGRGCSLRAARAAVPPRLAELGLPSDARVTRAYPHELSGGMQQRVVLAMALAQDPALLVADEPSTALDPRQRRLLIALLRRLQQSRGLGLLLATHDLELAQGADAHAVVIYGGQPVEEAATSTLLAAPRHPYSAALLEALPRLQGPLLPLRPIPGAPPEGGPARAGCAYLPRCPRASAVCEQRPRLQELGGGRRVACHHPLPGATAGGGPP